MLPSVAALALQCLFLESTSGVQILEIREQFSTI